MSAFIAEFASLLIYKRSFFFKKFDVLEGRKITFLDKSGREFQIKTEKRRKNYQSIARK